MRKYSVGLLLLAACTAEASHFRGAAMIPSVNSSGLLTVTATSFWRPTAVADIDEGGAIFVAGGVGGMTQVGASVINTSDSRFTQVTSVHQVQLPGAGTYSMAASSCCRVGGIINASENTWTMNSGIYWDGSTANTPIQFNFSAVQPEVVRNQNYVGNLGAVAGPGLTLTYDQALNQNINSQPAGFTINPTTGALSISGANTNTYLDNPTSNVGADYAFSGNIRASDGSFVEFDWLFDAVATSAVNRAPVVDDAVITILQGQSVNHTFTGTDPDGNPLTWSFVDFLSALPPALSSSFNAATQQFTWNSTGSALGTYLAQVRASDGLLTDIGQLTINVVAGNGGEVPEPGSMLLLASGLSVAALVRRRMVRH